MRGTEVMRETFLTLEIVDYFVDSKEK